MAKRKKHEVVQNTVIERPSADPKMRHPVTELGGTFSGIARSVECYLNQGFRNFRIITLHLKDGVVTRTDYSDPYASFEAISRLELLNEMSVIFLNNKWENGRTPEK